MPVPPMSSTATAVPSRVVTGCTPEATEENTTGSVPVVPDGIACASHTATNPLKSLANRASLVKLNLTSVAVTVTLSDLTLGIPPLFDIK